MKTAPWLAVTAAGGLLGACTSGPSRAGDAGVADGGIDVHDSAPRDATIVDVPSGDVPLTFDVTPQDALGPDGPFGDGPVGTGDGSACVSPGTTCDAGCVDVASDPSNCGGCGVVCVGSCALGRCLETLAIGQELPFGVVVVGGEVCWTDQGSSGAASGSVVEVPVGGLDASAPPVVAMGQASPGGIAALGTSLYWVTEAGGTVVRLELAGDGGAAVTLASGQSAPTSVTASSAQVYWTNGAADAGSVMALSLADGGAPRVLAAGQVRPTAIASDVYGLYWASESTVAALPLVDGGVPVALAAGSPTAIAVAAGTVFWSNRGTAANLYNDGAIMSIAVTGGSVTTLATGQNVGTGIAVDAASVYWTTVATPGGGGNIVKVALAGGTLTTLATGESPTGGIAVDMTSVYWTSSNAFGSVVRLTPK